MRNIEKMIKDYREWQEKNRGGIGDFTATELYQLEAISRDSKCEMMCNSLYVGFMAGYKRAKEDAKKKAKKAAAKKSKATKKELEAFITLLEGATTEAKDTVKCMLVAAADHENRREATATEDEQGV